MEAFDSTFRPIWDYKPVKFPEFTGLRIQMMPVRLGFPDGVPESYLDLVADLYGKMEVRHLAQIGYLTIDERELLPGETLRREGLHVDGYYHGRCGAWGGGGGWGSVGNGMLTVSSTSHCKAYLGRFNGTPGPEGECDHLVVPNEGTLFEAGKVYWVDGACVHESLPVTEKTRRQFVRLSMPSNGPWFEGYTENPKGILPSGEILPARTEFMRSTRD